MPVPTLTPTSSRYYYDGAYHTTAGAPTPTPTPTPTPASYPVYAERTKTADPAKLVDGAGTDEDPWSAEQARTLAAAGDKVGVMAGVYAGRDPAAGGNSRFTPAFLPTNSGTSENKIYYIAEHPAADPATDPSDYTEMRSGATVAGSGWPAFGTLDNDYVEFIGFYTDESAANNKGTADSGPCTFWTATGGGVHLCKIMGITAPFVDNHNGIRLENFEEGRVSSNYIEGFYDQTGGGALNQAGIMTYTTLNTVIEHNHIVHCGENLYIKGGLQYGNTIRYNLLEDATWDGMRLLSLEPDPLDATNRNEIYQNIIANCFNDIEIGFHGARPLANDAMDIFNNTTYITGADNSSFALFITDSVEVHTNVFRNNIVYGGGRKSFYGVESADWDAADFVAYILPNDNCFYGANDFADGYSGSDWNQATFSSWKSLTGADEDSQVVDPLFVDAAGGDFRLQGGSPCLSAGVDFKDLLGGGTSAPINQGAYISAGQTETIGIQV